MRQEPILDNYYSEELDDFYEFKMEGDKLRLYINGIKNVQLRCVRDELFNSPMCEFTRSKKNYRYFYNFYITSQEFKF